MPSVSPQTRRSFVHAWLRYSQPRSAQCYAAVVAAVLLGYAADAFLLHHARIGPFSVFYLVAILATWCGGLRLGLVATLLAAVVVATQFLPGPGGFVLINPLTLLATFFIVSTILCSTVAYAQVKRRMAEESGSLARTVVDTASDAIFVKDARGRYLLINEAGARFAAKSVEDIIGKDDSELFANDDAQRVKSFDRAIMATGKAHSTEESVVVEGRERVFLSTKVPYRGRTGEVIGVVGISRDVTEQRRDDRASRLLSEATALLGSSLEYSATMAAVVRSAVPTLGDGCSVHIIDEDTGALQMLASFHRDPAKMAAGWEVDRKYPPNPNTPHGAAEVIRTGVAELIADTDDEIWHAFARSPEHLAMLRSFGIRSLLCVPMVARSKTLGAMTFAMVESGRRFRPEDVPLATEIARRAAIAIDHARMYELTRQAVTVREDFLSIASHELRTPLTALQISVQRLVRSAASGGGLNASSTSMLATVDRSTRRLTQLVDQLLDISRLMSQRSTFEYEDVDAFELVPEVVSDAGDALANAGCAVSVIGDGDGIGRWNRERLRRVVANLLSNAAKYGPGKPIEVAIHPSATTVQISVTDHGIGIPNEMQHRIFDRFERAVSEREYGGFGLGLWIAKQIVAGFGGRIEVDSTPGKGATFTVTLPRHPPEQGAEGLHRISA
jgi:PAS domain S-box-containing protein